MNKPLTNNELRAFLDGLGKREAAAFKGNIIITLKIGYVTFYRKFKKGFEDHELDQISKLKDTLFERP